MPFLLSKIRLPAYLLLLLATYCFAQNPAPSTQTCVLHVHVDNLRNTHGVVGVLLFTSPTGWPENVDQSVQHNASPIEPHAHDATVSFDNIPPGNYAIVALHDENRNMKLDRNFVGWPKEGFGFANNPHIGLSAPSFHQALFSVQCPVTDTTIHMVYK